MAATMTALPAPSLPTPRLADGRCPARGLLAALRAIAEPRRVAVPALPARVVQERLVAHRLLGPQAVTGLFDRRTLVALATFQRHAGLEPDGIPSRMTADALLKEAA
jgi:peptidoglycan hydrolase-like protein with peptidoglycan-binding domain